MADPQNVGVSHWVKGGLEALHDGLHVGMKPEAPYLAACHAFFRHATQFNGMSSNFILLNSKNIFMSCICHVNVMYMICQKKWFKKMKDSFPDTAGIFFTDALENQVSYGHHNGISSHHPKGGADFWTKFLAPLPLWSLCTTPNIKHLWRVKKWTPFRENWWFTYKISLKLMDNGRCSDKNRHEQNHFNLGWKWNHHFYLPTVQVFCHSFSDTTWWCGTTSEADAADSASGCWSKCWTCWCDWINGPSILANNSSSADRDDEFSSEMSQWFYMRIYENIIE